MEKACHCMSRRPAPLRKTVGPMSHSTSCNATKMEYNGGSRWYGMSACTIWRSAPGVVTMTAISYSRPCFVTMSSYNDRNFPASPKSSLSAAAIGWPAAAAGDTSSVLLTSSAVVERGGASRDSR